jgi:hypothetical protein
MAKPTLSPRTRPAITYDAACDLLETVLNGEARGAILDAVESTPKAGDALARLRAGMRAHRFPTAASPVVMHRVVQALDQRTRREGFHVLESWDYRAHRFADDITPVLMLDRCAAAAGAPRYGRRTTAVLLDQYFLSLLGLLAVRAWDAGDPNANLDRVTRLVRALQAGGGSGQQFVDDAETLLLLAISHYHPEETAYDQLIQKVWTLDERHRLNVALACAASLGSHLRWGFRFMYKRDVALMRADNVVDYPWLLFAVFTLARQVGSGRTDGEAPEHEPVVEALLNALAADPWAFTATAPGALHAYPAEHAEVRARLRDDARTLLGAFERHRPHTGAYSPLGFQCNFLCNTLVAMVATALSDPTPRPSLNGLFTATPLTGFAPEERERYARTLMAYAGGNGTHSNAPALIVYDPYEAIHSFNTAMRVLGEPPS